MKSNQPRVCELAHLFYCGLTLWATTHHHKARYQMSKTATVPQVLLQLFQLVDPKLTYPASPIFFHENYNKRLLSITLFLDLGLLADPRASPHGVAWHIPFSLICLFNSSHFLICWPCCA